MVMVTTTQQKLTFDQFLDVYPDEGLYEFVNGEIVAMAATRNHEDVADYTADSFKDEIKRLNLDFVVKTKAVIKTVNKDGREQGRLPDVSVIDRTVWRAKRTEYSALQEPIQLAVEVTSTNWEDDYIDKLDEYQRLGIPEYWIVDYLAIASREYLGNPKVPTVFVYLLDVEGKYQVNAFRDSDRIMSPTFPDLQLTAAQVLKA
jgi:Uma2 family endonuclease